MGTLHLYVHIHGCVGLSCEIIIDTYLQLAEMVNLHFLSLLESLLECNSSVFNRLLPLWSPVLFAHSSQVYVYATCSSTTTFEYMYYNTCLFYYYSSG